jgi:hypothetical protein
MDWLALGAAAYAAHAMIQALQDRGLIRKTGVHVRTGARLRLALLWPLRRVTSTPVQQPVRDAFLSAWVGLVELSVVTIGFVLIYGWLEESAISEGLLPFAVAGSLVVAAVPLMLLSWMIAALVILLFRAAFAVALLSQR